MRLYQRRVRRYSLGRRIERFIETTIKSMVIMSFAAPFSWVATIIWYFILYRNGVHLNPRMEVIATATWIPLCGLMYGFLAPIVIGRVFDQYTDLRMAIKDYDFITFMKLRDEDLSPLIHALMTILGLGVLAGFMLLAYPDFVSGFLLVGSVAYLIAFIFFVVREIDDPLAGVWFIKNIPDEWMKIDLIKWRQNTCADQKQAFEKTLEALVKEKLNV